MSRQIANPLMSAKTTGYRFGRRPWKLDGRGLDATRGIWWVLKTHDEDVVPARGRDLERALGVRLPLHLSEVHVVLGAFGEQPRDVDGRARKFGLPLEILRDFREAPGAKHAQAGDDARLGEVLPW